MSNYIPAPNCYGNCPNPQGIYFQPLLAGAPCPPSHPNTQSPNCPPPQSGINTIFTSNMLSGYNRFGCSFLYNRHSVLQNKLNQLQSVGTNPLWQQMLQNRIGYIMNLIMQGCTGGPTPPPSGTSSPTNPNYANASGKRESLRSDFSSAEEVRSLQRKFPYSEKTKGKKWWKCGCHNGIGGCVKGVCIGPGVLTLEF